VEKYGTAGQTATDDYNTANALCMPDN